MASFSSQEMLRLEKGGLVCQEFTGTGRSRTTFERCAAGRAVKYSIGDKGRMQHRVDYIRPAMFWTAKFRLFPFTGA